MPFISIDQEGGMVTRIMKEATFFPGNMTISPTFLAYSLFWVAEIVILPGKN